MARYALTIPQFAQIVRTKETTIEWLERSGRERDQNLRNTNKLLWMLDDADGVKTGTTGEAGQCLVSSATRGQQRLIAVVLNDSSRWYDSMQLLKFGFDAYDLYQFAECGDVVAVLPVEKGLSSVVDAVAATDAAIVVDYPDYQYISVSVDLPETIKAPIYQGQKLGEILIFVKDKAVKSIDIVAAQAVEEHTFKRILLDQLFKTFRTLSRWGVL
jgi:D-alanyl-D-alanine carboxypeptidase (penicillin-binding protein 5/6)